jgi:hypothetical protein
MKVEFVRRAVRALVFAAIAAASSGAAFAASLCDNSDSAGVLNNPPTHRTPCNLRAPAHITQLITYHWNNGRGARPGTILFFNPGTGVQYGPYPATGSSGQGGAPNVNWTANVNINVPAGQYQVIDSDFATWSWNSGSGSAGFAKVYGDYTSGGSGPVARFLPPPGPAPRPAPAPAPRPAPPPPVSVLTHTPCHANSSSFVEMAKPVCFGSPGTTLTLYVSRVGLATRPAVAAFRSGAGYNSISMQLGGAMNTPGLPSVFTAPLTVASGNGLAPNSTYTFTIPAGACFSGRNHTWWFDLWVAGSGDVDAVAVRC